MSQGWISKILKFCDATETLVGLIRCDSRRSLTTAQEDRQLISMAKDNHFISPPLLHMEVIHWFRKRMSVQSMVNRLPSAGYRFKNPARCPWLNLDHRWRCRVWERTHRWDLRHWTHCAFGDESRLTLFHSDACARVCHIQWERLIKYVCI